VGPSQNYVRQRRPVSKMATVTKNKNFFKWPKLLYFKQKVPKFELYGCGGHLGRCSEMPDTNLKEDHPRIISAKFG
jgi:hypothetical protein